MQKPELQDFGVTPEEYALYIGKSGGPGGLLLGLTLVVLTLVVAFVTFVITRSWVVALAVGVFAFYFLVPCIMFLVWPLIERFKTSRLFKSPVASQINRYEVAQSAYEEVQRETERARQEAEQVRRETERVRWAEERAREEAEREALRKREGYWNGLSDDEFELELGALCERRGYKVSYTGGSSDGGADLILRKKGKKTVVQCKRYRSPVGVAVVRELYGTMVHLRANNAILACTGGFTKGVKDFARGKPIILVDAPELARMSEIIEAQQRS